jgi:hypothetical protein
MDMFSLKDWCPDMDKAFPTWEARRATCFHSCQNMHADMPRWTSITDSDVQKWRTRVRTKGSWAWNPMSKHAIGPSECCHADCAIPFFRRPIMLLFFAISQERNLRASRKELWDQYQDLFVLIHKVFLLCAKSCVHVLKALGVEVKPRCCCCTLFINEVYKWVDKDSTRSLANGNWSLVRSQGGERGVCLHKESRTLQ